MQILVRENKNGTTNYVWKKVDKNKRVGFSRKYYTEEGQTYYEVEVLKVKNDFRKNSVICNHCGTLIKNTPEAIERHYKNREKKINCLQCSKLRRDITNDTLKTRYKKLDNGNYLYSVAKEVQLSCNAGWSSRPISMNTDVSQYESSTCQYLRCRASGVSNIESDFFLKYPNAFDVLITENNLLKNNWRLSSTHDYNRIYMSPNTRIKASCDLNGVVQYFVVNSFSKRFTYSSKYDLFIRISDFEEYYYVDDRMFAAVHESNVQKIKEEIRNLYK